MIRVLIDTDIHIDFLKNIEASKKIFQGVVDEKVTGFSSVITEAELFSGKECNDVEKRIAVEELLAVTERITVNSFISRKAADFRRIYDVPMLDALIAASAIVSNSMLCSRNTKHFKKIKELKLKVPY
ncbi:MAG: PIN domain-containing protein [Candidatus Aenigmarchaeota archaeon]|nr:PIN domain-containing protein [Candidatus Aenigmarchaeota archaeon]